MEFDDFLKSLRSDAPPPDLGDCLTALWLDAKGDWQKAHAGIDSLESKDACWVHAYLHRKEGDIWNAGYWYAKAGKKSPDIPLNSEWEAITKALLKTA